MAAEKSRENPLRETLRPNFELGEQPVSIVDLFCGCGGLTLGVAQAALAAGRALEVMLAVDSWDVAAAVFAQNFSKADVLVRGVRDVFNGEIGRPLTYRERRLRERLGVPFGLVGGPPCQGHSDLNNHTRREDPKNELYLCMARAAAVLRPTVVLIENVPGVKHAKPDVVSITRAELQRLGYAVGERVVAFHPLGVAQRRRRHVLLATLSPAPKPAEVLNAGPLAAESRSDLRAAIGDLRGIKREDAFDQPPRASEKNLERMRFLLASDAVDLPNRLRPPCHQDAHSYKSMYGRLRWDAPAQTITSGFGSIGQGRYMHPDEARALTPHEAARIQGFPDFFDFRSVTRRADLARMIGNAVPPALASWAFGTLLEEAG